MNTTGKAVFEAARKGDVETLTALLRKKEPVDYRDEVTPPQRTPRLAALCERDPASATLHALTR